MCHDAVMGTLREHCKSASLTCELVAWSEGGELPGPAGDTVMGETVTCEQDSLLFSPAQ